MNRRSILLTVLLAATFSVGSRWVVAQQSIVPPAPTFSQEKLWGMYGQAVAETKVQQEYIQTLQAKITELNQKLESCRKD